MVESLDSEGAESWRNQGKNGRRNFGCGNRERDEAGVVREETIENRYCIEVEVFEIGGGGAAKTNKCGSA